MTKQLSPGEISAGMFVTVIENKPFENQVMPLFGEGSVQTMTHRDRSGYGEVLSVLAVELPYVVVRSESIHAHSRYNYKVDTRRTTLMELSNDYVSALCPYLVTEPLPPSPNPPKP
jgi:hypothetical protein